MLEVDSIQATTEFVDTQDVVLMETLEVDKNAMDTNNDFDISQNKKNSDIFYINFNKIDTIHDVEMWDVKGNYDFNEKTTKNDTPYLSIQHNLNYHYNLKNAINEFECPEKMEILLQHVKNKFLEKSNENEESEFYLNTEELNEMKYKSMLYSTDKMSKLYFAPIYKLYKNATEMEHASFQHIPKIYVGEEPIFFDNVSKFIEFVENRTCSYKMNIYFKLILNKKNMSLQYTAYIYSVHFPFEPYYDTSIRQFNNYTDETRKKILHDIIEGALQNTESLTSGSIPMIFFKNCIFKMGNIDMRNFTELFGKQFHPKFYGGKNTKYDPNSNAKESLNMIANDEIVKFLHNIENLLNSYSPMIKDILLTLKKEKKINIKLQKKDDLIITVPLSTHKEIEESTDSEDEEIHFVEDGKEVRIFNIKQSSSNEDNSWHDVPARRVNYTIRSPYIFLNKLWYNNSTNTLESQFSFSKKLNIVLHENKNMDNNDSDSLKKLMEEFENN